MAWGRYSSGLELTRARLLALSAFAASACLVAGLFAWPDQAGSVVAGPMTPGHESLSCTKCHTPAPGTLRQQVQANLQHWAGLRGSSATFAREPVDPSTCRGCHVRDNDRHPSFRFREPRFAAVNKVLDAKTCLTCHTEHIGQRVANDGTFCSNCHHDMKARHEAIQPTHAALVAEKRWSTCLTCHDFHGNHPVKPPTSFDQAHDLASVRAYLADGPDPYSKSKTHKAVTPRDDPSALAATP